MRHQQKKSIGPAAGESCNNVNPVFGDAPGSLPLAPHQINQSPFVLVGTLMVGEPPAPLVVQTGAAHVSDGQSSKISPLKNIDLKRTNQHRRRTTARPRNRGRSAIASEQS
jgi:hypothetical protein